MGIQLLHPDNTRTVIVPFTKQELANSNVQCWCSVQTHEHNLVYSGNRRKKTGLAPGFIVEFSVPAFRALAKTGNEPLKEFAKKLSSGRPVRFSPEHLPLDAAMHQCIYALAHYEEDPSLKEMYLYTRVIDLLRLQQQSYIRVCSAQPAYVKTEYDKERIVFARDYLLTHMDAPPTLARLAAIAGINEFKLKRGFRELFNQTVFGYLADVRLEMACTALRQKQKPVTRIAFELGYASLQHFSMAFKKKFGVSPREFR
jgi:AraC family transcriptional regulator, transcriptional activator of the genes for pyochelin and ferripyochelin receptors